MATRWSGAQWGYHSKMQRDSQRPGNPWPPGFAMQNGWGKRNSVGDCPLSRPPTITIARQRYMGFGPVQFRLPSWRLILVFEECHKVCEAQVVLLKESWTIVQRNSSNCWNMVHPLLLQQLERMIWELNTINGRGPGIPGAAIMSSQHLGPWGDSLVGRISMGIVVDISTVTWVYKPYLNMSIIYIYIHIFRTGGSQIVGTSMGQT